MPIILQPVWSPSSLDLPSTKPFPPKPASSKTKDWSTKSRNQRSNQWMNSLSRKRQWSWKGLLRWTPKILEMIRSRRRMRRGKNKILSYIFDTLKECTQMMVSPLKTTMWSTFEKYWQRATYILTPASGSMAKRSPWSWVTGSISITLLFSKLWSGTPWREN